MPCCLYPPCFVQPESDQADLLDIQLIGAAEGLADHHRNGGGFRGLYFPLSNPWLHRCNQRPAAVHARRTDVLDCLGHDWNRSTNLPVSIPIHRKQKPW